MANKLAAEDQVQNGDVNDNSLQHLSNSEAEQKIAEHLTDKSNELMLVDVGETFFLFLFLDDQDIFLDW